MNNNDNTSNGLAIFFGILGIFLLDYSVDPIWYGLSWLLIIGGAFGLYANKK